VVVIGRGIAFFKHPLARVGAVIALSQFLYSLWVVTVQIIDLINYLSTEPENWTGMGPAQFTVFGIVNSLGLAFFVLALAVILEYASRISSDFRRIRARREIEPSEDS